MFDLGWTEILVIAGAALIVVGPKDLPVLFKKVGNFVGKARKMAREFQSTMEAAADETGLKETTRIINTINSAGSPKKLGTSVLKHALDSETDDSLDKKNKKDLKKSSEIDILKSEKPKLSNKKKN